MKKIVCATLMLGALVSCASENQESAVEVMATGLIALEISTESPVQQLILEESKSYFQEMGYGLSINQEGNDFGTEGVLVYHNPMGLFSIYFEEEIPDGAIIAVPQENQSEALLLLEEMGLISLAGLAPFDLGDVEANYFDLVLMEAEIPVDLITQVDYVVETGENAYLAGLPPALRHGRYGAVYVEDGTVSDLLIGDGIQDFIAQEFQGYLLPLT